MYEANRRYYAIGMQHLAGSVAYVGILTLLPVLTLLFAVAAKAVSTDPELRGHMDQALAISLGVPPDLSARLITARAEASVRAVLGTVGVVGVIYAGLEWIDAYRRALRAVWPDRAPGQPAGRAYARDFLIFLLIVAAVLVLLTLGLCATANPYQVLAAAGHGVPAWLAAPLRIVALLATIAWAGLLCAQLYRRLGRAPATPGVRQASLLAGAAIAALVVTGLVLLRHVFADPLYGMAVAMIGWMLWVSAATRVTLSLAIWSTSDA